MSRYSSQKNIYLGILFLAIILMGYLFIFPYHYKVGFDTKQPPGVVFDHLRSWPEFDERDSAFVSNVDILMYERLVQDIKQAQGRISVDWLITRESDSTTRVEGRFSAKDNALIQKLAVPFGLSYVPESSISLTQSLAKRLIENGKNFRTHGIRDTVVSSVFYAYIPVKTKEAQKAQSMLREISTVMDYIKGNDIPLSGDPFIQVTSWDPTTRDLSFDFCFPIDSLASRPSHPKVQFGNLSPKRYLKTMFNGNYRISQQGWYTLMDYAHRNDIELGTDLIEIYRNDPHQGGDSMEWVAEILMPIIDSSIDRE